VADRVLVPVSPELQSLYDQVKACSLCELSRSRTLAVPGEGPSDAEVLFVGEAPGFHEDQQGRPFVGAAGHFLDELLGSIHLERGKVYIANTIKCRPPGNRDPKPEELAACKGYLDRQISLIRPKVIVTLGRFSMVRYFGDASISRVHGQAKKVEGMMVMAIFHPAAALHQPRYRTAIEEDFAKIPRLLAEAQRWSGEAAAPSAEEEPEQLSLF
jgi:uracil-DNA glycosylase